jgi:hypothetical protein
MTDCFQGGKTDLPEQRSRRTICKIFRICILDQPDETSQDEMNPDSKKGNFRSQPGILEQKNFFKGLKITASVSL